MVMVVIAMLVLVMVITVMAVIVRCMIVRGMGVRLGLRRMGMAHGLRGAGAARLKGLCAFLGSNLHRMNYDQYLRAGYPIATGVIEGACRHLVRDRMERAGMRWKVPGAHAMLQLRAVSANGDWDALQAFRIQQENSRLYPHKDVVEAIPWPIAA